MKIKLEKMFVSKNFKDRNYKLETMGTNILFSKPILLKSAKISYKAGDALKASNKRLCRPLTFRILKALAK